MQLNLLVSLITNPNCTKSKSFYNNSGKSNSDICNEVNGKKFVIKENVETEKEL